MLVGSKSQLKSLNVDEFISNYGGKTLEFVENDKYFIKVEHGAIMKKICFSPNTHDLVISMNFCNSVLTGIPTVYPKKYAHGFCFAVLCCGYTLTDFPTSIRLTSLALWQSNDCPSASKATLMNMDKYFMWIHYERLHNHNKAKHNKTVCIFLGIYCKSFLWHSGNTREFKYCLFIVNKYELYFL